MTDPISLPLLLLTSCSALAADLRRLSTDWPDNTMIDLHVMKRPAAGGPGPLDLG